MDRKQDHLRLAEAGVDAKAVIPYPETARRAVADGVIGYEMIVAQKTVARE